MRIRRRARRWRLWSARVILLLAVAGGAAVTPMLEHVLTVGGFTDPGSSSSRAADDLARVGLGIPNLTVLVSCDEPTKRCASAAEGIERRLRTDPRIGTVEPAVVSPDDRHIVLGARLAGDEDTVRDTVTDLGPTLLARSGDGVDVELTGQAEILRQVSERSRDDLLRAELIAVPATLVLLLIFFRGLLPAMIPVTLGVASILVATAVIFGLNLVTPISVYATNLIVGLALGLSIDYSLLVVARFREAVGEGLDVTEARALAVARTARTITISAVTIVLCLSALLVIPLVYLRSLAIAGIVSVVAVAALVRLLMPTALDLLGRRWARSGRGPATAPSPAPATGRTGRLVALLVRRRTVAVIASVAFLAVLILPFLGLRLGPVDQSVLPETAPARVATESITTAFPDLPQDPLLAVGRDIDPDVVESAAGELSRLPDVGRVVDADATLVDGASIGPGDTRYRDDDTEAVLVLPQADLSQTQLQDLASDVRAVTDEAGLAVAGLYSADIDSQSAITDRLPYTMGFIVLAMIPLVLILTGGVVTSVKAVLLTAASLSASFGLMVWVFQDGHLSGVVGVATTGTIDATSPVLMFCLAFGLSMDYQIFLLARMREEFDRTGDNATAVVTGLTRTAGVISAAAVMIAVVFLSIGTSGISFVKLLGIGLAVAVLVDAFVVRTLLVPSLMLLIGPANWWAPPTLARWRARLLGPTAESA